MRLKRWNSEWRQGKLWLHLHRFLSRLVNVLCGVSGLNAIWPIVGLQNVESPWSLFNWILFYYFLLFVIFIIPRRPKPYIPYIPYIHQTPRCWLRIHIHANHQVQLLSFQKRLHTFWKTTITISLFVNCVSLICIDYALSNPIKIFSAPKTIFN
jgi:hypothetical protein